MSDSVKWLYPGAENTSTEMSETKESAVSENSSTAKSPVADISKSMTAASNYMGSLFQNSWYGGSSKNKSDQSADEVKNDDTASTTASETSTESNNTDGQVETDKTTSGSGIAKSTSAFFSNLVTGVSKAAATASSPTQESKPVTTSDNKSGLGMLTSAFSKIAYSNSTDKDEPQPGVDESSDTPVQQNNQTNTTTQFSLSTAFSKVGEAASSYSKVLQDSVVNAQIFQDFNQQQQNFIKSKGDKDIPVSPWSSYENEDELREKILCLSTDQRNFLRAPPAGVEIEMDSAMLSHHALFLLKEDPRLQQVRYELVPKQIKEDEFWKNYFYRVGVVQQSYEMKPVQTIQPKKSDNEKADSVEDNSEDKNETETSPNSAEHDEEFISDSHQVSSSDLLEADEAIKKLGLHEKGDAEWEAELEGELEYEMVEGGEADTAEDNPEWEQQIQEMLDAEETVAK